MRVGDRADLQRSYFASDAAGFAELAGVDAALPEHVPEPLVAALFSFLLGVKLPGPGTNYLKQEMAFQAEVRWGEMLTASVEITGLRADKNLVDLATQCLAADGRVVCRGRALVLFRAPAGTP